jgi:hypothetical protein
MLNVPTAAQALSPAIGWIGLDAPLELIEAAGRRPQRITANLRAPATGAAPYGEGGGNPWMRALISAMAEQAPALERVVLTSTPVTEVWLHNFLLSLRRRGEAGAFAETTLLNLSHEPRTSAHRLNVEGLRDLAVALGVDPAGPALVSAMGGRNRVRAVLRRIDTLRHGPKPRLTGAAARRLMDPADSLASDDYVARTEPLLQAAESAAAEAGMPVIYSGPGAPDLALYDALEARGLRVVGDDCEFGTRAIGPDTAETSDPLEALAERYRLRSPAPAGWTTRERTDWLVALAQDRGAKAVLFDLPPWGHPAAWDWPQEARALEAIGVACIPVPHDDPGPAAAAVLMALESAHV